MNKVTIYVERLDIVSAALILRKKPAKIVILDERTQSSEILIRLFKLIAKEVQFQTKPFRDVSNISSESLWSVHSRSQGKVCFELSERLIRESSNLSVIGDTLNHSVLTAMLARTLQLELLKTLKVLIYANYFGASERANIFLDCPIRLEKYADIFSDFSVTISTYRSIYTVIKDYRMKGKSFVLAIYYLAMNGLSLLSKKPTLEPGKSSNGLLVLQSDDYGLKPNFRRQLHWENVIESIGEHRKLHLLQISPFQIFKEHTYPRNMATFPLKSFANINDLNSCDPIIRRAFSSSLPSILKNLTESQTPSLLYSILLSIGHAVSISAYCLRFNIDRVIGCDPWMIESNACSILSRKRLIEFITYQYSNLSILNPQIVSVSDKSFIFHKRFKSLLSYKSIGPDKFVDSGIVCPQDIDALRSDSKELRNRLQELGVSFIITYFDENFDSDNWGLVTQEKYVETLDILSKLILAHEGVAVVIKPQFVQRFEICKEGAAFFKSAVDTGRFVILCEGSWRNHITVEQAGLAADLVIGEKFGATAGLLCARLGIRCVLIDEARFRSISDEEYSKVNIVFGSLDLIVQELTLANFNLRGSDLGNWTPIIREFDSNSSPEAFYKALAN